MERQEQGFRSWSEEWKRTRPDLVVYLPREERGLDADNEHFLVFEAPYEDHLLAMWTQAQYEGAPNQHIALARSVDGGATWSAPQIIAGPADGEEGPIASWGFPIVSKAGRIYCFFNKFAGVVDTHHQMTGWLGCVYSDDNGRSWKDGGVVLLPRSNFDHPDPQIPPNWIAWQKPIRDSKGRWIVGFTRHLSKGLPGDYQNRCEFIRFANIDEGPDPQRIEVALLPLDGEGIRVPVPGNPHQSYAEEPSIVLLPDGRLFCTMRTATGRIWYSVSDDDGETWRQPEVMRYEDGGEILNPISPCPIYALNDGRFLLFYHNNDGSAGGGTSPYDPVNRHRAYLAVGTFAPDRIQPIRFSRPLFFADTDLKAIGPTIRGGIPGDEPYRVEVSTYASLTERHGKRILWYPDRKHFLLGRYITDEFLAQAAHE